jgi:hypothetical protein
MGIPFSGMKNDTPFGRLLLWEDGWIMMIEKLDDSLIIEITRVILTNDDE